jgi:VanZ family protein
MKVRLPLLPDVVRWSMVLAVAAVIFYGSIMAAAPETPIDPLNPELFDLDKWRHFVAYGALGGSLSYALADRDAPTASLVVVVASVSVAYGFGIELWQSLLPDRYFSLGDAYANALGALLSLSWYLVRPYVEPVPVGDFLGPDSTPRQE